MSEHRDKIIDTYARWTALSALRSGSPIKSRTDVYAAMRAVDFAFLFDKSLGPISQSTFDAWHAHAVEKLREHDSRLNVGWATKIVNVYLKTRCYIGAQGRHHLADAIHPPIDGGLWDGIEAEFRERPDIVDLTHCVRTIRDIKEYECYSRIIQGCRMIARERDCKLIEVEQFWDSGDSSRSVDASD